MSRPRFPFHLMILVLAACLGLVGPAGAQTSLNELLTPYLGRYHLPALAAAVVQDGKVVASGAVGTRRAGSYPGKAGHPWRKFFPTVYLADIPRYYLFGKAFFPVIFHLFPAASRDGFRLVVWPPAASGFGDLR